MKALIAEDDLTSRLLLSELLAPYGTCHTVVNGKEAVQAFLMARASEKPYDLICLDIMMPEMDGQDALKNIREIEDTIGSKAGKNAKVIMVTALDDMANVFQAYKQFCDDYLVKPINKEDLIRCLSSLGLVTSDHN
jgi:two-component system, chemotaxis family, chemotaxis protein CheY